MFKIVIKKTIIKGEVLQPEYKIRILDNSLLGFWLAYQDRWVYESELNSSIKYFMREYNIPYERVYKKY